MAPGPVMQVPRRAAGARAVAAVGMSVVALAGPVQAAGGSLDDEIASLDYWIGVAVAVMLGLALVACTRGQLRRQALAVWIAKVVVALGFMLLYERHYSGELDSFSYFDPAAYPFRWPDPSTGTRFMLGVSAGLQRVLGPSYHGVKVVFAFVGLLGIMLLVGAFRRRWPGLPQVTLLLVGLFPSVLFWSTILGKEPMMLLAIGLTAHGLAGAVRPTVRVLAFVSGLTLALAVRPWVGAFLAVPSLLLLVRAATRRLWPGQPWARLLPWGFGAGIVAGAGLLLAMGWGTVILDRINRMRIGEAGIGGSSLDAQPFEGLADMVMFWPWGAFTALFRPLPGEALSGGLFGVLAGLDSALLVGLVLRAVRRGTLADLRDEWAAWSLGFIGLWLSLYAYLSSLNLGTAARYRLQVLPVILLVLLHAGRRRPRQERSLLKPQAVVQTEP